MQQEMRSQKLEKKVNEFEKKLTEARKREEVMIGKVEKYRQLFENESDAVMVFDAETLKFEDANRATLSLYGYSKQEFLALNVEEISAEKEKTRITVKKLKAGEPGSENVALRYFRKKDGTVFPGEICAGIFTSNGRKKIIGAVRNITDRKQAEEALRESEERYRTAIENSNDGVAIVKGDNHLYVNQKFAKIFGYGRPEEVVEKPVSMFVHPDDRERVANFNRFRQKGKPSPSKYECKGMRKDGETIYLSVSANKTTLRGEPVSLVFLRDVTDQRRTEMALQEKERRFRELFEHMGSGVAVYRAIRDGEDFIFIDFNKAGERIDKIRRENVVGRSVFEIFPNIKEFGLFEVLQRVWKTGKSQHHRAGIYRDERLEGWRDSFVYKLASGEIVGIYTDETKRKQAENALRESEEKYRHIFENIQDVYYEVTLDGTILEVSPSIEEISAYKREDLKGKSLYDIYADPKRRDGLLGVLSENEKVTDYEIILKDKNGSKSNCSITARLLRDEKGNPQKIVGTMRDIRNRKRMEEELRESEETLKAILAVCPVGIGLVRNRTMDWANAAMYRISGYEEGSLLGEDAKVLYLDDDESNRVGRALYQGMDKTGIGQTETRWITKEGGVIDCHLQASPLDPKDPGKGHIVAAMDITDRKRAEDHIHTLTQQLMKAQENERQRISLYLHDDVAQNLSTVKIGLETIFDDQPTPPGKLTQRVSRVSQILQTAISAVRDLAYDQRPPGLDQLGLVQAVFQYCESFSEKHGLRVDFHSAGMDDLKLDFDTEINLYRLIQEGLTNVKKHADASRATVRLVAAHPHIILRMEDNGKGFDVEGRLLRALDDKRMGLQGMEERVNLLNGQLRIQSRLGEGTRIFIEVPYKEKRVGSEKKHPNHR